MSNYAYQPVGEGQPQQAAPAPLVTVTTAPPGGASISPMAPSAPSPSSPTAYSPQHQQGQGYVPPQHTLPPQGYAPQQYPPQQGYPPQAYQQPTPGGAPYPPQAYAQPMPPQGYAQHPPPPGAYQPQGYPTQGPPPTGYAQYPGQPPRGHTAGGTGAPMVVVVNNGPKEVNHGVHCLLFLLCGGLWLPCWCGACLGVCCENPCS